MDDDYVFLTCRAPRGPIRADLVGDVVQRACKRAGLPNIGAHGLRRALAGELLRRGAGLVAISQVLRHQDLATTALYAKVDLVALRQVAQPWPGVGAVSALEQDLADYLELRRSLGHAMAEARWLLPGFVAYLDAHEASTVTIDAALNWAQQSPRGQPTTVGPRRMTAARGFARYLARIYPGTEIPPLGLMPHRPRWRRAFIYSTADIEAMMSQARISIRPLLRAATYETLIGLLAAGGLRIGEAIKLDRSDIDWSENVLPIRESKFGKSRLVPLHSTAMQALSAYAKLRDELEPRPEEPSFFESQTRKRLCYAAVCQTFRQLVNDAGVGAGAPSAPRLHDLRHSFAVRTLLGWYRSGEEVQAMLPWLSTYLGHREPASTYWYLSAAPELLSLAAERQNAGWSAVRS